MQVICSVLRILEFQEWHIVSKNRQMSLGSGMCDTQNRSAILALSARGQ